MGLFTAIKRLRAVYGRIADRLARPTLVFSRHLFVSPRITVDGERIAAVLERLLVR